jgi:hypothetical protein
MPIRPTAVAIGNNAAAMNRQNIGNLPPPTTGAIDPNQYKSSFATPSSYSVPSSVPVQNPWFSQPHPANVAMAQSLRRR